MHRSAIIAGFVAACVHVPARAQSSLDFDGAADQVTVLTASGLIFMAPAVSLSTWFYPRGDAPMDPERDGLCGFRNGMNCDFYLARTPENELEGQMRTSTDMAYTIVGGELQLNAWNHAALVFDGSTLKLFLNSAMIATIPAEATFTNTNSYFLLGRMAYDGTMFEFNGRLDDVGLWKRALNPADIACLAGGSPDLSDPDLLLFYRCDQGIPGGNNTSIDELVDAMGNINGDLLNFNLNGNTSNFVEGPVYGSSVEATVCPYGTYMQNGQALGAGTYAFTYTSINGCDSFVTVTVEEDVLNVMVNPAPLSLTSMNPSASWQWLDCENGFAEIPGASFQTFSPTSNGSYAVEVTDNGCVDTSACYEMTSIGIEERLAQLSARLFPTVTVGPLRLLLDEPQGTLSVAISDALGRVVMRSQAMAKIEQWIDVSALGQGTYSVLATANGRSRVLRFVRE